MKAYGMAALTAVGCLVTALAWPAHAQPSAPQWDKETLDLVASLPVQDGGRIKPLDTLASFKLLQINGRRKCTGPDGSKRSSLEWFLDCLFYPEIARAYPIFLVQNADALVAAGAPPLGKRRGRYTYEQLAEVRQKIFEMARTYAGIPEKELDPTQRQALNLDRNMSAFEDLTAYLAFARHTFTVDTAASVAALFPGQSSVRLSDVLVQAGPLREHYHALSRGQDAPDAEARERDIEAVGGLFAQLEHVQTATTTIALFPPAEDGGQWLTVSDVIGEAFDEGTDVSAQLSWLRALEDMAEARDSAGPFRTALDGFRRGVTDRARARGEYDTIELEVTFYRAKLFYRSLVLYIMCFLLIAASWLLPGSRVMGKVAPAALCVPTALLVVGIVLRCIIRSRPPVTTLYETVLFVTAVTVVLALFAEYVSRQRIALAVGGILGVLGMLLANKYEVSNAEDTMPSMVAVLDTNFWLAAHVTTIIIGYAASLLSGALAHVYILAKVAGVKRDDPAFYKTLTRMVYGILCFGFLFTFAGTVLGGIWANESWGRFWGWDPKENGALLIVLWQLATLHARLGGYIRDLGVNMAAVAGAAIVAFSWWGVNLLGIGLHAYGFTSGTMNALLAYWAFEVLVIFLGSTVRLREWWAVARQ